jgi:hypothetical protein
MDRPFQYHFDWDLAKCRDNFAKHGISFNRSSKVFLDPNALSLYDDEHSETEDRWLTLGLDQSGNLLVVCHTFEQVDEEDAEIRIISARKATMTEIGLYTRK